MLDAPKQIITHIERFERNTESYHSQTYNETQLRREFIDPFFEVLGWDVTNKAGYAEAYKDVIHEDAIKVGSATKAPDYCFRIGGVRKFFLETKKPAVGIKEDVSPAYQLRRYAWSAKLPLSILTDFEEFAVYDCRFPPKPDDKPSTCRILYLTYQEYASRWEEIASIFSKEAVLQGSFDKFAVSAKGKRGTATVDAEFLTEIEMWRDALAHNFALRNPNLTVRDLNFAVQRTIDRIIFLRMCEDRGVEPYGQLQALLNGENTYQRLRYIYGLADDRYNSGLFHFKPEKGRAEAPDELTLTLAVDDKALKDIIRRLYYPESPYEFSVLSADILGNVYEQFLGKVIRLTAGHQARIEDKPEVKKAGGVYYTPAYIVDYIVKNTVGKLCEGKTPKKIAKLRILDPACGSGSFLIGAYQCLLNYHRDWYVKHRAQNTEYRTQTKEIYQGAGGQWLLTTQEKKRILLNNIYGVDIDSQAVEVTKLSLLLKVLEGENKDTLERQFKMWRERALPDLGSNIKCGNSLIGPDFYNNHQMNFLDDEDRYRINVFDWKAEFPHIFSSPSGRGKGEGAGGFDAVIGNPPYGGDLMQIEREYLEGHFKLSNTDTAALFMVKQTQVLKEKGRGGFIVPKPFVYSSNWVKTREKLLESICHIADVSKVWKEVKLEQVIYFYQKGVVTKEYHSCIRRDGKILDVGLIHKSLCQKFGFFISGVSTGEISIAEKMQSQGLFLNDLVINQRGAILQKYVKDKPGDFQVLGGKQINRYAVTNMAKGFIPKEHVNDEKAFIKPDSILAQNIVAHIQNPIDHIEIIATLSEQVSDKSTIIVDTINQLQNISNYSSMHLLGILNSKLISWYVYRFIFAKAIRTMHFDSPVTSRIPYPKIDLSSKNDNARHDRMVVLVDQMLELHKRLRDVKTPDEKTRLQRQIDATDGQIDRLVYELYGLTEEEIKIVES